MTEMDGERELGKSKLEAQHDDDDDDDDGSSFFIYELFPL